MAKTYDSNNKSTDFFFNQLPSLISSNINVLKLGKITKYDKRDHTCDVQPLRVDDDGNSPIIVDALVPSSIWQTDNFIEKICENKNIELNGYKKMKVGSVVTVGFFDRDMDKYNDSNKTFKSDTDRKHSINDSIILEVVKP